MSAAEPAISEAFGKVCELGYALGMARINELPGCWEHQVDARWWIALNGHGDSRRAASPTGMSRDSGFDVPPYTCYVEFNGWAFGIFSPYDGTLLSGELANEDTFIAALDAAIAGAQP